MLPIPYVSLTIELSRQKAPVFGSGAVICYATILLYAFTYNVKLQPDDAEDHERNGQKNTQRAKSEAENTFVRIEMIQVRAQYRKKNTGG